MGARLNANKMGTKWELNGNKMGTEWEQKGAKWEPNGS